MEFDPYLEWLDIPESQRPPTLYQLLGVDSSITDVAVVKSLAFQRIAKVRHFQRGERGDVCARLLEELSEAEATLTNPVRRAEYDGRLAESMVRFKSDSDDPPSASAVPKLNPAQPVEAVVRTANTRAAKRSDSTRSNVEVVAVPAVVVEQEPRRRSRRRRTRSGVPMLPWILGAVVVVVVGTSVGVLVRSLSGRSGATLAMAPGKGMLGVVYEREWPDAVLLVDNERRTSQPNGATMELLPGELTITVAREAKGQFTTRATLKEGERVMVNIPAAAFRETPTVMVNPGAVAAIATQNAPPGSALAMPVQREQAVYMVFPKEAKIKLIKGKASITSAGNSHSIEAFPADFDVGVEIEISCPGFNTLIQRVEKPGKRRSNAIVQLKRVGDVGSVPNSPLSSAPTDLVFVKYIVVPKDATIEVVNGTASVRTYPKVSFSEVFVDALRSEIVAGVELSISYPGYATQTLRVDPRQDGRSQLNIVLRLGKSPKGKTGSKR